MIYDIFRTLVPKSVRLKMEIWIIVATARDRAIGRDGTMPWRLKDDLRRLKATTTGHAVIMGRHTWDSIGARPLPNRYNIVVSRTMPEGDAETHYVASTLEQALQHCQQAGYDRVYIMGGGVLYKSGLPYATHLNLTMVDTVVPDADTHFPEINLSEWSKLEEAHYPADERNDYPVTQTLYKRIETAKRYE